MSLVTKNYTFSAGATIIAAQHNSNFDTIFADYNGSINNANIASNAAIAYTKLNLNNAIVGSDINTSTTIPVGVLPTGTSANQLVKLDSSAKLPAVDASALTGITGSQISGLGGTVTNPSAGSAYLASATGIISIDASATATANMSIILYSDTNNPPTTEIRRVALGNSSGTNTISLTEAIPKNNYYKFVLSNCSIQNAARFSPIGA